MQIEPEHWPAISALLDDALALPAALRRAWLDAIPDSTHRATLELLLTNHARLETEDFLNTFPRLALADEGEDAGPHKAAAERVGPYRLLRELGRGGMGTVWLAERSDGLVRRTVALKLPHPGLAVQGLAERLARERDILASLVHPNIARLYDAGLDGAGQPFIALEYVAGRNLIEHADMLRMGLRDRIGLFRQVLEAVHHAHTRLVVHRDLKPSNVLVDENNQVRLLDFGIAKLLTEAAPSSLTLDAGSALTPDYASPEQLAGAPIGTASDVYSLGVLLYELLVGLRPYRLAGAARGLLEAAILAADVRKPSAAELTPALAKARSTTTARLRRDLAGDLDTVVLKALQKDPLQRYDTVRALAEDLDRHLQGQPVHARPDAAWYLAGKFVARNKAASAAASAAVLALVLGAAAALWQAERARAEADNAKATKSFLLDLFKFSAPSVAARKLSEVTVRELLDQGERRIAGAFTSQPQTRHEVLMVLATLYDEIGLPEQELRLCRDAAAVAEQGLAGQTAPLADAWRCMAQAQEQTDREAAALTLAKAERLLAASGDDSSLLYSQVQTVKASLMRAQGSARSGELIATLKRVIPVWREHFPRDPGHSAAWAYLANAYWDAGEPARAMEAASQSLAVARANGDNTLTVADAHFTRATYRHVLGDFAGAEQDYLHAATVFGRVLGEHHPRTLRTECLRGRLMNAQGQRDAGLALLERAVPAMRQALPGSDALTICLEQQGYTLIEVGRADRAQANFTEAAGIFERAGDRLYWGNAGLGIAQGLDFRGHYDEARKLVEAVITERQSTQTVSSSLSDAWLRQSQIELHDHHLDRARRALQSILASDSVTKGARPRPSDLARAQSLRAEISRMQGRRDEAAEAAETVLALVRENPMPTGTLLEANAQVVLGRVRCEQGQAEAGLLLLLRGLAQLESRLLPSSPSLAEVHAAYGLCLLGHHEREAALEELKRSQALLRQHAELGPHFGLATRALQRALR